MKKRIFIVLLALCFTFGIGIALQNVVNYNEQGGARTVIGGSIDVISGGDLDIESGGAIKIAGTAVTSTAAELNILDGCTATFTELNLIDGVTATTAELNILDGCTATFTELNLIDGVTATTAELNIVDGCTATFTELNLIDGVTKTTAELNQVYLQVQIPDVSTASSTWVVSPIAGNIGVIYSVINGTIATADAVITFELGGTAVTGATLTITESGSAAGDVDTCTASALNAVTAGSAIEIVNAGASTNTIIGTVIIIITAT